MIYEMRIYYTVPGQLNKLNDRFANHTMGFFNKHGIGMLGFWTDLIGISNRLTYILSYDNMGDREAKWDAFQADKGWQEVRSETEKDGALVASVENSFLSLTPYSPQPKVTGALQELRTYHAIPGKIAALHDRFANMTIGMFDKHGIDSVGYWTAAVGTSNQLVYMIGYPNMGHREQAVDNMIADPEWQKAYYASERDGPILRYTEGVILKPTSYSPR